MATKNRGGSQGRDRNRGRHSNNPTASNQYSGVMSMARDNPIAAAAVAGGVLAAGVFLWSRRNQVSDQIGSLTDQITEWREGMVSDTDRTTKDERSGESSTANTGRRGRRRSQDEISAEALTLKETGKTS